MEIIFLALSANELSSPVINSNALRPLINSNHDHSCSHNVFVTIKHTHEFIRVPRLKLNPNINAIKRCHHEYMREIHAKIREEQKFTPLSYKRDEYS